MTSPGLGLLRETLLSNQLVTETQWDNAVKIAHIRKLSLETVLREMGTFEAQKISQMAEILYGIPRLPVDENSVEPACRALMTREMALKYRALPLALSGNQLTVGMVDPMDVDLVDSLRYQIQHETRIAWISPEDFERGVRMYDPRGVERILEDFHHEQLPEALPLEEKSERNSEEVLRLMAEEAPVVRLANMLFSQAISARASDIHIEPGRSEARVRIRVDGCLHQLMRLPMNIYPALASRLKLIAHLDIAERRLPQDGRYACRFEGRPVDMRMATTPSLHGEKLVIRLIDAGGGVQRLSDLGYGAADLERIHGLLARPYGMILVTGPTGSGKSTTLYAALDILNTEERNIQTIEDPIERNLEGICQVQAQPNIGLSFARVLRSFLRQDPDVIMLGEVRDAETAEIAIQAALTGHLVLSSLHTNDAVSTVMRLVDMGIPAYKVAAALRGVLAQRLVRRLCGECAARVPASYEDLQALLTPGDLREVYRPVGCAACSDTGYRGRVVVSEVLVLDSDLSRAVAEGAHAGPIMERARAHGMTGMREDALRKVASGLTSVQEAVRATLSLDA